MLKMSSSISILTINVRLNLRVKMTCRAYPVYLIVRSMFFCFFLTSSSNNHIELFSPEIFLASDQCVLETVTKIK